MTAENSTSLLPLRIECFGAPNVILGSAEPPPDILWRKNVALLIYLALSPGMNRHREHLLGLLWPEKSPEKARHSLNEAVRRLRAGLGKDRLLSRGDLIELNATALEVDALASGANSVAPFEFLEGFYLEDAPEFEQWMEAEREKHRVRAVEGLLADGGGALGVDPARAREVAVGVLQLDPHSERGISLYMRAAALAGDASAALVAYNRFATRLKEIGENPSRAISGLAERVRMETWRRTRARDGEAEPPMVGRKEANETAFSVVADGVHNGPACLVLTAEPGMGRTRLVSACLERLALDGATVAHVRPLESDGGAPWTTLRALARAGFADATGLLGTDPGALAVLASVVPVLAERFEPAAAVDNSQVATSLLALVEAIAEDAPVAIAIDDAHFSDSATLGALQSMMSQLHDVPVVLILSVSQARDDLPRELLRLQGEIGRSIRGAVVALDPLSPESMVNLVEAWPVKLDGVDEKRLARRIGYEAGGSPFFAVELLRGLEKAASLRDDVSVWPVPNQTLESPLPFQMPTLVRRAIAARIVDLDSESRHVLCTSSVGGQVLDLDLVSRLSGLNEAAVDRAIGVLERHDFIEFDGQRYLFRAPVIAEVVMQECLTRGEKQRLRRDAIRALEERDDLDSRVLSTELQCATDPGQEAFDRAIQVANQALDEGLTRTAKRAVVAAQGAVARGFPEGANSLSELQVRLDRRRDD